MDTPCSGGRGRGHLPGVGVRGGGTCMCKERGRGEGGGLLKLDCISDYH